MKKSKIIKAILSPIIKGLAIFAIFGFALYVYGAISYPADEPNPVSGVVGIFVGVTGASIDGALGSYNGVNAICSSAFSGSHICTPMEIINTYNNNPASLPLTGVAWLNSGAPGNTYPAVNDCNGWTDNSTKYYGNVWSFAKKYSGILPCKYSLPVVCCK